MGRPALGNKATQVRLSEAVRAQIEALCGKRGMAKFIRDAVDEKLARSAAPPVQDTKARPVAVDEGKQAELRSSSNTKAAKTTARISVDVPLAGTFKRPIPQKSSPKPKR